MSDPQEVTLEIQDSTLGVVSEPEADKAESPEEE